MPTPTTHVLMTGFPGFLGSALLPRILRRRSDAVALCLVQERFLAQAEAKLADLAAEHPEIAGRVELVVGDITVADLGLDLSDPRYASVVEVWHLAAVYDLAVGEEFAERVNVQGTANVLEFCSSRPSLERLQYVSTCYVSGDYAGEFGEDALEEGQEFLNFYESTKHGAEVLVREAIKNGLPATIYRPGIVVGDSTTGETQKYDGPYFLASFMLRQPKLPVVPSYVLVPRVANPDQVRIGLVPRDFVIEAMDVLGGMEKSVGRTYALTSPNPPTVRELAEAFAAHLDRKVAWLPLPLGPSRALVGNVPGVESLIGFPAEGMDYFAAPTTYSTANTLADLEGTGVTCPEFADYAGTLIDYMVAHPEFGHAAMV